MDDIIRRTEYDPVHDRLIAQATQNVEPYLRQNELDRADAPEHGKYRKLLTKVASIPLVVVEQMKRGQCCADGKRYDLLSADPDERRRALCHVQSTHRDLLTIAGTPFAMRRPRWV